MRPLGWRCHGIQFPTKLSLHLNGHRNPLQSADVAKSTFIVDREMDASVFGSRPPGAKQSDPYSSFRPTVSLRDFPNFVSFQITALQNQPVFLAAEFQNALNIDSREINCGRSGLVGKFLRERLPPKIGTIHVQRDRVYPSHCHVGIARLTKPLPPPYPCRLGCLLGAVTRRAPCNKKPHGESSLSCKHCRILPRSFLSSLGTASAVRGVVSVRKSKLPALSCAGPVNSSAWFLRM